MSDYVLELSGIRKIYRGGVEALKGIDLRVPRGCDADDKSPFTISGVFGKVDRKLILRLYPGRVVRRDCVCGISLEAWSLGFFGFLACSCGPVSVS